jgi:hypothetical protein
VTWFEAYSSGAVPLDSGPNSARVESGLAALVATDPEAALRPNQPNTASNQASNKTSLRDPEKAKRILISTRLLAE